MNTSQRIFAQFRASSRPGRRRVRVNDRDMSVHPEFHDRAEVSANGLELVPFDAPIPLLQSAHMELEMWGGHPGTGAKEVSVNGRETYAVADPGTLEGHCTYTYPLISINPRNLVRGANAIQFGCDRGDTFWGHFILDDVCLCGDLDVVNAVQLYPDHLESGLRAVVSAEQRGSQVFLGLETSGINASAIERVDFLATYTGYDESGCGQPRCRHGFTRHGIYDAHAGGASIAPYSVAWEISLLPAQTEPVEFAAVVALPNGLRILSQTTRLALLQPAECSLIYCTQMPRPFWSRASKVMNAIFDVPWDPSSIVAAEFHVRIWDGGEGNVQDPIIVNDFPVSILDGRALHDIVYARCPIPSEALIRGSNRVRVLSDTEHHGLEITLPGPGIVIRHSG